MTKIIHSCWTPLLLCIGLLLVLAFVLMIVNKKATQGHLCFVIP